VGSTEIDCASPFKKFRGLHETLAVVVENEPIGLDPESSSREHRALKLPHVAARNEVDRDVAFVESRRRSPSEGIRNTSDENLET